MPLRDVPRVEREPSAVAEHEVEIAPVETPATEYVLRLCPAMVAQDFFAARVSGTAGGTVVRTWVNPIGADPTAWGTPDWTSSVNPGGDAADSGQAIGLTQVRTVAAARGDGPVRRLSQCPAGRRLHRRAVSGSSEGSKSHRSGPESP